MNLRSLLRTSTMLLAAATMACEKDDPVSIAPEQRFTITPLFVGIDPGATQQVSATIGTTPVAVTWESSDPAVATVDGNGLVTGLTSGFTAVTATQTADPAQKISSNITVLPLLPSIPLTNGVPLTGLSRTGAAATVVLYRITVPAGKTKLTVSTTGPDNQDVDIFVRKSLAPVVPVTSAAFTADCKSDGATTTESCSVNNPAAGTWYIAVQLWTNYSGVTLTATYTP
jgi:hypothetical protein